MQTGLKRDDMAVQLLYFFPTVKKIIGWKCCLDARKTTTCSNFRM